MILLSVLLQDEKWTNLDLSCKDVECQNVVKIKKLSHESAESTHFL